MSELAPEKYDMDVFYQWAVDCGFINEGDSVTRIVVDVSPEDKTEVRITKLVGDGLRVNPPPAFKNCTVHTTETVTR